MQLSTSRRPLDPGNPRHGMAFQDAGRYNAREERYVSTGIAATGGCLYGSERFRPDLQSPECHGLSESVR